MLQFSYSSQEVMNAGVKALIYAPSGIGKTMLCATAPAPIIISAESGLLSLSRGNIERVHGVNTPGVTYDLPVIKITTVEQLTEAYQWFSTDPNAMAFKTICLDSVTEIGETVLSNAKKTVKDPRQAYGELIEKMTMVIKGFRDLPGRNVVFLAKSEYAKDEVTGISKYAPAMPGSKLGQQLPYYFDEVFRLDINKAPDGSSYRFLQTQPDLQYTAKDRSGALNVMEPPHLTHVFNKIQGL